MLSHEAIKFLEFDIFHSSIKRILNRNFDKLYDDPANIGDYVNHFITTEMEESVCNFLSKHKINFRSKLMIGLNQVKRNIDKFQIVIIAKNIKNNHQEIIELLALCHSKNIPVAFSCTRNKLSQLFNLNYGISCLGVKADLGCSIEVEVIQEMIIQNRIIWRLNFVALSLVVENNWNESPIWIAAYYGFIDKEILTECIANGWDINEPDSYNGFTPLMIAVKNNHALWTKWLLDAGADMSLRCFTGGNCLSLSISLNSFDCFALMMDHGMKSLKKDEIKCLVMQKTFCGDSCIEIAKANGNQKLFIDLLSKNDILN